MNDPKKPDIGNIHGGIKLGLIFSIITFLTPIVWLYLFNDTPPAPWKVP